MSDFFGPKHGIELVLYILGALSVGAVLLGALCLTPKAARRGVVMFVTFVSGLYLSIEFLIPRRNYFTDVMPDVANAEIIVGCFTLFLGTLSLFMVHGKTIKKRKEGWSDSLAFFIAFFSITIAGFIHNARPLSIATPVYNILFFGFMIPMRSTTFSLVAFYIVSATYRAFRIHSAESVFMMVTAAIVMLAMTPIGAQLTNMIPQDSFLSFLRVEKMGYWILASPNMAVQRAIAFGIAVGALAMGLRVWLSLERGSFFDRQM